MTKGAALILAVGMFASSVMIYLGLNRLGLSIKQAESFRKNIELSVEGSRGRPLILQTKD